MVAKQGSSLKKSELGSKKKKSVKVGFTIEEESKDADVLPLKRLATQEQA